jgi:biotin carboxylase
MERCILYINLKKTLCEAKASLLAAIKTGYKVVVLNDTKPDKRLLQYIHAYQICDTFNYDQTLHLAKYLYQHYGFKGVLAWHDENMVLSCLIAQHFNLTMPPLDAIENVRDKYITRLKLKEHMPEICPRFSRIYDETTLKQACHYVGFPAILKPTKASGSRGIYKVNDQNEAFNAFQNLKKLCNPNCERIFKYHTNEYIFEQYLQGDEISVEGWVNNGQIYIAGITDKFTTETFHIEYQHIFPSKYRHSQTIKCCVHQIIQKIGLDYCTFHLELIVNQEQCFLVEIAPRPGGDCITSSLVPLASNIDFFKQAVLIALNQPVETNVELAQYAGIRFLLAEYSGIFQGITNLAYIFDNTDTMQLYQLVKPNAEIKMPPVHFSALKTTAVISERPTYEKVKTDLTNIANQCRVIIK